VKRTLYLGCTADRHHELGAHAAVNARAGQAHLNMPTIEDIELMRDAIKIREHLEHRVRFYQFNSRFCRRHQHRLAHLLSDPHEF